MAALEVVERALARSVNLDGRHRALAMPEAGVRRAVAPHHVDGTWPPQPVRRPATVAPVAGRRR
ncbi:hypothetical protein [Streptomyces sp. NPDC005009]